MKEYYRVLIEGIPRGRTVINIVQGLSWMGAELDDGSFGIAMNTPGTGIAPMFSSLVGLDARDAAQAVMSWNMQEASAAMAVINAYYNSPERLSTLDCAVPYERVCTCGMDTVGKSVAFVGHLIMPDETIEGAKKVYILERRDIDGDYPDSACEYILPECELVIITGSASVNKTMPRLLELSHKADIIVIGPTTPMCPELIKTAGISRLSGMVVTDKEGIIKWMTENRGSPYAFGQTFLVF